MSRTAALLTCFALAASALTGCAKTAGEQLHANIDEMNKEHTPEKLWERGKAFASIGDYTRAEEYFMAAMDAGGSSRKIMPMLVRVCVADNRLRSVVQYSEPYLAKYPDDTSTRFVYGTVLYAVGDYSRAKDELVRVAIEKPEFADAHFALALSERELGQHLEADVQFREYLRVAPRGSHAAEAQELLLKQMVPTDKPPVTLTSATLAPATIGAPATIMPMPLSNTTTTQ